MKEEINIVDFVGWINELKYKIHETKRKIAFTITSQITELYWDIGKSIAEKQINSEWGSNFIDKAAIELKLEFPDIKGFSRRNLYAMSQLYRFFSAKYQVVPQCVAQLPWGHTRLIISKIKDITEAEFYCNETIKNGWDRETLELQIKNNFFLRIGKSINNFNQILPSDQSELVSQMLKDPYNFDFLGLYDNALEKAIEDELTRHITEFLLELGKGFAFLGRQFKIEISETDYYLDMLFYHVDLRCYVVIELKSGKFKPEFAGKLNFYLSAVDSQIRKPDDNPTIGILLCKNKDKVEVEYALRDIQKPMGISEFRLTDAIPENFRSKLPTIEELESQLENKK